MNEETETGALIKMTYTGKMMMLVMMAGMTGIAVWMIMAAWTAGTGIVI
jgi:hypothetical protein